MKIMKKSRSLMLVAAMVGASAALTACGELPQDAQMQLGKYRGKADSHPWQGEAQTFAGSEFKRGDKASWDKALATRAQAQNEYTRVR